ncbi:MAG: gluconate 2-dehydrogenase subunit 3 family protein [Gammaproteobacteria bacterium]|nr:gluconate 2-dehydrogenase subunit 3 family protein [Gammaproteobacteria bacterium]
MEIESAMTKYQVTDYLKSWGESVSSDYCQNLNKLESRRSFLKQVLLGTTAIAFSESVLANSEKLNNDKWVTISAVQLHLFPVSKNSPDAQSINASAFLKSVLEWPGVDKTDKKFVLDGVGWLNGLSDKLYKVKFYKLDNQQKEIVLRAVEKSQAGENWLALILLYLMEALLADPSYGGNTDAQGWKWLQHQPGFPRPAADKRYFNL